MKCSEKVKASHAKGLLAGLVLFGVIGSRSLADEVTEHAVVTAEPLVTETTFFTDESVDYGLELTAEQSVKGKLSWQLSTLHRSLGRGDVEVEIEPAKTSSVSFRLRMPHIKEGVVQQAVLRASLQTKVGDDPLIIHERELSIFPLDPFTDRAQWLDDLELQLFDPSGQTAKLFDEAAIPFRKIGSATKLRSLDEGMIVVGEGIALQKHSGLADVLLELAAEGRSVLWLAPEAGELELPGSDGFLGKSPKSLSFRGSDMIEQLDKRLDAELWSAPGNGKSVGLGIVTRRNHSYVGIVEPGTGWSWMHAEFADPEGHLLLCGLRIVDCWDKSPTPRFMLARLLERLNNTTQPTEPIDQ